MKTPITINDITNATASHPLALQQSYIIEFQFSPVKIWKIETMDQKKLSKLDLGIFASLNLSSAMPINRAAKLPISKTLDTIVRNNDWSDFQFLAILKMRNKRSERKIENELEPAAAEGTV